MNTPTRRLALAIRLWHGLTALLFIILATTGIKLHFSPRFLVHFSFALATRLHNTSGIALAIAYALDCIFVFATGYWRQYIPVFHNLPGRLSAQLRSYTIDLGRCREHTNDNTQNHFNALQQLVYFIIFFCVLPLLIISGLAYLYYPVLTPDSVLGLAGLWPVACMHYALGILGIIYLITHVYMAVSDTHAGERFKRILTGRMSPNTDEKHACGTRR